MMYSSVTNISQPRRHLPVPTTVATALMLTLISIPNALAQAADTSDIAEGGRLFRQKGNCQSCHGWAGDGRKMDTQMPDGATCARRHWIGRTW
jgi:mono/diheme cytochrome c family protein